MEWRKRSDVEGGKVAVTMPRGVLIVSTLVFQMRLLLEVFEALC